MSHRPNHRSTTGADARPGTESRKSGGFRFAVLAAILLLGLASCGFQEQKDAAETSANRMFEELSRGLSDAYFDLYSDEFYTHTSRGEWRSTRQQIQAVAGDYRSHELMDWNASTTIRTGSLVVLIFRVSSTLR